MRLSTIAAFTFALFAVSTPFAHADEQLDKEIAEAKQKFCGGKASLKFVIMKCTIY